MYTKYLNWCSWISKLMIVYWPVLCKILFTGLYYWNLLHLSVIWQVHSTVHINIELKAESNKVISVLAQTQVYMASKAFWEGTAYLSRAPEFIPVFNGVRVTSSLVLCVFCRSCLSFCTFSFGQCVVCSSSIYRFWLPLWYLQTPLTYENPSQPNN